METPTIIIILLIFLVIIVIVYYLLYLGYDNDQESSSIPSDIINQGDNTIIDIFRYISVKYSNIIALKRIHDPVSSVNFYEYYNICERFAKKLLYWVGPHPRVAILSQNRPEWYYVHLGTMIANGISICLNTANLGTYEYIINHSCADVLIVDNNEQLEKIKSMDIPTVRLILVFDNIGDVAGKKNAQIISYDRFMDSESNVLTRIEIQGPYMEDIAWIIYTSDNETPKGTTITHGNIMNSIRSIFHSIISRSNIGINIKERYISYLPIDCIVVLIMDIYIPLVSVGTVYFVDTSDENILINSLKKIKPTIFSGNNKLWNKLVEIIKTRSADTSSLVNKLFINKLILKEIGLNEAKYCINQTYDISDEMREFYQDIGIELCNVYGMNETCFISMCVPGCSKGVGMPLMSVKIDPQTSEIMVKGGSLFKKYHGDDKSTKKSFNHKGWFKTGNIGYIERDGSLYIKG